MENKILKYNNDKGDGRCVKNNFNCTIVAIFVISEQAREGEGEIVLKPLRQQGGDGG